MEAKFFNDVEAECFSIFSSFDRPILTLDVDLKELTSNRRFEVEI